MSLSISIGRLKITFDRTGIGFSRDRSKEQVAAQSQRAWSAVGGVLEKMHYRFGDLHGVPQSSVGTGRVSILRARRPEERTGDPAIDARDVWLGQLDGSSKPGTWLLRAFGTAAGNELRQFIEPIASRNGIDFMVLFGSDARGQLYEKAPPAPAVFSSPEDER